MRTPDITGGPLRGWILVAGETLDDDELHSWRSDANAFAAAHVAASHPRCLRARWLGAEDEP